MPHYDVHPIRDGIIATVAGGLLLATISPLRAAVRACGAWLWDHLIWLGSLLTGSYPVKGWILAILIVLAGITVIRFLIHLRHAETPAFQLYREDQFYGAVWRWSWVDDQVVQLWCFCPRCDLELSYDDSACSYFGPFNGSSPQTVFGCEHCRKQIAQIPGGNRDYALSVVRREIARKIRTNDIPLAQYGAHRHEEPVT
jgi:hypothetical protein